MPAELKNRLPFLLYLAGLAALALYATARSPVVATDNDLWYHLSHGRHLFDTGRIPDSSYFSFISPPKVWVDYYWLFQAVVYPLFEAAGYGGLIALRTLVFGGFLLVVAALLFRGAATVRQWVWFSFVFGLVLSHALFKFLMVRPHILSYLFLALFLYLLEAGKKVYLLPVLALLWVNFHGVEYPVILLVAGAYLLEIWWRRLRAPGDRPDRRTLVTTVALGLSMAAVFVTPHGGRLIAVPFVSTEYASVYLDELSRLGAGEFLSYRLSAAGFTHLTAFNLLLLIAVLSAIGAGARRELRLSHLLLFAGGLVLTSKAVRLSHECALLSLPLVKACGPLFPEIRWRKQATVAWTVALLALATPVVFFWHRLPDRRQSYPLSLKNLPHGIASFLNRIDAEGRVMNNPNVGGYLQWALDRRYRIFMDLEIPFLFADEDMYEVASAFFDPRALERFLDRYQPPFVAATLASGRFPSLIAAHPAYVAVFFDDQGVLYVDRRRYGEIAERHALTHVDPWNLGRTRFSALSAAERRSLLAELRRLSEIDPDVSSINQAMAILENLEGRHRRALEHAARVIAQDPALARGHAVRGDALVGRKAYREAAASYRRALVRSTEASEKRFIYRSLATAWRLAGRPREAYEALKRGVGIFNVEASHRELYELGVLAAAAGEPHEAQKMFTFALVKVPAAESDLRRTIEEHLAALGEEER